MEKNYENNDILFEKVKPEDFHQKMMMLALEAV